MPKVCAEEGEEAAFPLVLLGVVEGSTQRQKPGSSGKRWCANSAVSNTVFFINVNPVLTASSAPQTTPCFCSDGSGFELSQSCLLWKCNVRSEGAARWTPLGIPHLLSGSTQPRPYLPCCFTFLFAGASPTAAGSQTSGACSLPSLWPGRHVTASSAAAHHARRCCKPFSELGKAVSTSAQTSE